MSPAIVRPATPADLPSAGALGAEIVRVHHEANPQRFFSSEGLETGYAAWLEAELDRADAVVLVAELAGQIVGYAYGAIEPRDWSILVDRHGAFHDLCVAERARRQGIGRQLAHEMIRRLEGLGAERILARVMVQNDGARRLMTELGFSPTMTELTRERR